MCERYLFWFLFFQNSEICGGQNEDARPTRTIIIFYDKSTHKRSGACSIARNILIFYMYMLHYLYFQFSYTHAHTSHTSRLYIQYNILGRCYYYPVCPFIVRLYVCVCVCMRRCSRLSLQMFTYIHYNKFKLYMYIRTNGGACVCVRRGRKTPTVVVDGRGYSESIEKGVKNGYYYYYYYYYVYIGVGNKVKALNGE